ncbi:sugar ABC transporter substrate-binding protein [Microlunatus panaciterrae]|uniref:Multiple sugar transport system substrate-binding protein n=1 Tax=Microlunatus panaciterrae TaxID=400768 RepID=A0ABS2RJP6_9ACTN|nr:extracellular solute-binding protein [Microlunatus panaciterrae]MBM7798712.1 multiple sugar transport system substrate-binding protein [Microlunatus panaciterrae]
MTSPFTRRRFLGTALAASSAVALAACSGGGGKSGGGASAAPKVTQAQIDEAMNKDTTLTLWTWVPDIQKEVDLFTKKYPKIKVKNVNVGAGAPHYTKMRAAIQSGQGAPDVAQVEFQYIPSFTLGGNLLDLSPYGADSIKSQYPEWVWSQVSKGEVVYAIPQDVGPMGLLYRDDLLKAAGVKPPKTWDEFATAAEKYRSANPKSYLSNLAPNDPGQFVAFLWQIGARPFSYDGTKNVKVDLASDQAKQVAKFWGDMVAKGVVSVDPDFTDAWYQGFSNGKYAAWPAAAWGPVFLQGTAKKTSGKWRATDLPQWDAAKPASGNWGGSTDAVLKSSKNPIAASQLALFINTDKESALKLATEQFLFPPSNTILNDPAFADQAAPFYGGQKVNAKFTDISATVTPDFQWLPFMDFVYSNYTDTLGKAMANKTDMVAGLQAWQDGVAKYAKDQGFNVA